MSHFDVNQAIAGCKDKSYRDVLPLLEQLCLASQHAKAAYSTESLATAMHRIASTGSSDPDVLYDRRFVALVVEVENRLKINPHEFNNQSLANVVWGAGKLRLNQRPDLFTAVEREVLSMNLSRRTLSSFTAQQLAAIAWGFVAADMNTPTLYAAIQAEARAQPILADLLQKAGLLQYLKQKGIEGVIGVAQGGLAYGAGPYAPHSHLNGASASHVVGMAVGGGIPAASAALRPPPVPNSVHVNGYANPGQLYPA
eukprot:CAMPEP_0113696248 /NCGR_PEP_ID=MMETSP0038_2-20120614/21372_1 /TAXON_ID=2898 /ORGANISM="Cryptomonas paramecium" /LENGTH=254 /DNA_ID=CAMNT_0000618925 /DNA_START=244 /DNA_END=1004 /DNA_ORIENTATION=- /assembly_acc=CAM_ASM_000170